MSLFNELKRRNVFRVAAAYIVTAWLVIQVVETIFPAFGFGDAAIRIVVIAFAILFVPVLILAWAFEWTPQGIRKEAEVDHDRVIPSQSGKKFDRIVIVILVVAVSYFALDKFMLNPAPDRVADNTIAVIPFVNMSAGPEQAFFADGVAEEVLNLLAKIPQLRVISRSSSFSFRGEDLDIPEIAKRLNVAHILEGSVRRAGNRIRITAQLIEANSDTHLWSETYDRDLGDVFAIQDEIAENIVNNLHIELVGPMPVSRRTNPEVLELLVRARQIFFESYSVSGYTTEGDRMAALLDEALEIDPDYVPAIAWYIYADWIRARAGLISKEEELERYHRLRDRALAIDPDQPMILQMMAFDELFDNGDPVAAATLYERALRSGFNDSEVLRMVGRFAYLIDRYDEANRLLERSAQLDPNCRSCQYWLSRVYMFTGKLEEAEQKRRIFLLSQDSDDMGGRLHYGVMKLLLGDAPAALEIFDDLSKTPNGNDAFAGKAMAFHSLGRHAESDEALSTFADGSADSEAREIAKIHAWRGEKDAAYHWIDRVVGDTTDPEFNGFPLLSWLRDPLFGNLHGDPRWKDLRSRLGWPKERLAAIEIDLSIPE